MIAQRELVKAIALKRNLDTIQPGSHWIKGLMNYVATSLTIYLTSGMKNPTCLLVIVLYVTGDIFGVFHNILEL